VAVESAHPVKSYLGLVPSIYTHYYTFVYGSSVIETMSHNDQIAAVFMVIAVHEWMVWESQTVVGIHP